MEDVPAGKSADASQSIIDFHLYSIDWSIDRIVWGVDGKSVRTLSRGTLYLKVSKFAIHCSLHVPLFFCQNKPSKMVDYTTHLILLEFNWESGTPVRQSVRPNGRRDLSTGREHQRGWWQLSRASRLNVHILELPGSGWGEQVYNTIYNLVPLCVCKIFLNFSFCLRFNFGTYGWQTTDRTRGTTRRDMQERDEHVLHII